MRKRLYRSRENRMIKGVCGGIGEYFGINPGVLRIAFLVMSMIAGVSILIYIALAYFIPERPLYMKPEYTYVNADYEVVDD